ncbi:MAG: hypothetical protein JXX14_11580 [Deltaproteobacteria bacterium]|nr:hypothetical protein [Deltaproteobacteria bacterium]
MSPAKGMPSRQLNHRDRICNVVHIDEWLVPSSPMADLVFDTAMPRLQI